MEFFALYADGEGIRSNFLVHLSDFTKDHSLERDQLDESFLERCVAMPEDVSWFFPRGDDIFGIKVRSFRSIRKFIANRRALRAVRAFNLTPWTGAETPIPARHCYRLAVSMLAP